MIRILPFIFCVLTLSSVSQITFSSSAQYYPGNLPYSNYCADFNGDGNQDFACGTWNFNSDIIYIYIGNGNGSFSAASYYTVQGNYHWIVGGDFNNDGNVDLASANGSNSVCVLLGNGNGTFSNPTYYLSGATGNSICSKDFNNDGFPDIATASSISNNINVLFGSLSGTFSPATSYSFGVSPSSIITGDYNSDGFNDLICVTSTLGNAYLLLGSITGTFSSPFSIPLGLSGANSISSGDLNNDGKLDLTVSFMVPNLMKVFLGTGNGTFPYSASYSITSPNGTTLIDLNCDGNLDFISVVGQGGSPGDEHIVTLKGNGNGTFSQLLNDWSFGLNPIGLNIGEFNGDGKPDFIAGNYLNYVKVALNTTSAPNFSINSSSSTTICLGQPITLTLLGAISCTWSGGITNGTQFTPTVTSTYTVTGTMGCGTLTDSITITTVPPPTVSVVQSKTLTCPQESLTCYFVPTATSWSLNGAPSNSTTTIAPVSTTFYSVTCKNSYGCVGSQTFVQNVLQAPTISVAGGSIVCLGSSITEIASGANSYTWSTGDKTNKINVNPNSTTIYSVTGSDLNGCVNSSTILVSVIANSLVTNFSYPETCYNNESVVPILSNGFSLGGFFVANDLKIDSITGKVDPRLAQPGSYIVNYSISTVGCQRSSTQNLVIVPGMDLFANSLINLTPGSSITLQPDVTGDHIWSPSAYLSCTMCGNPVTSPPNNIQYCILDSINSCVYNRCIKIIVSCDNADFSTPNAFTPNGDNNNDEFCLQGWNKCVADFNIKIFDRWGEKVYESHEPDFCWDGFFKEELLSADTFVFIIKATKFDKSLIYKKGNIKLIR